ncbi:metallophosphoesterase 1 [Trichogramma pretiosum]|uniref:Calcineurin-like phosphoesterase domain-containing protein n=1 Tax=Trichogramma kaykai TaxID=54128 RepID=A0ABD2X561_9HYME|nr:metallophosphoesterase 1 [Trichogramma pretiosum]XP_014229153.1 metallophosphoesterase 1 [Trichogramma pretiosum]
MLSIRYPAKYHLIRVLCMIGATLFLCEYLLYYIVLIHCKWPILDPNKIDPAIPSTKAEEKPVHAMFLADTHLLGSRNGHWFDKLRREWQMHRAFQTAMTIHNPDIVFILGDVFDEGQWCSADEFEGYIARFYSLFSVPKNTHLYVVAGNHDMGFHYVITPYLSQRFINGMNSPSVKRVSIRGNHFIMINSMALEGDGCFLCRPTEVAVNKISKHLKCAKGIGNDCHKNNFIKRYSRPILLQHYPLYRESDQLCDELDEAPAEIKSIKFRERWECLSKEASDQLLDILNPRLVVDGHTHHGCRKIHREHILEMTLSSFSWRNKDNPAFLLGVFTPNNYSLSKCYMPVESVVIGIYIISGICIIIYLVLSLKLNMKRIHLRMLHFH